ncbi:MAG: FlgD immunoglobulin-like domain containing protein [Candidatus Krumholzibacteriota bacterium]
MLPRRTLSALALVLSLGVFFAGQAAGQCILANPSFEIAGSGGPVFGGWNQFGVIGSVTDATHGSKAARVSGPNWGGWDVSGYWQSQDCDPGEQWAVTGHVQHPAGKPLTGACAAIVNIEWWDGGGTMIDFESVTVADAASVTDEYLDFSFVSTAAPTGTASIHLLLGVLQSPTDPSPDVYYDQVTLFSTSSPTIDEVQWNDFPGGNTLSFGGYTWRIKGPGLYGPGSNLFCDTSDCVWVDADGLHLTFQQKGSPWYATEVVTEDALGYGDYILTTTGRLDLLDPQVVLGIFLWEYGPCWDNGYLWWNAFNEIDIEYSYWGNAGADIGQFVAQPYDWGGNLEKFDYNFSNGEVVSHAMRWLADKVEYRVWRGGPGDELPANMIHSWTYSGPHIPRPEQPRMHLNMWRFDGNVSSDQEVVFSDFTFIPAGGVSHVGDDSNDGLPSAPAGRMRPAAPNPFNPRTTVWFDLARDGFTELAVYDLNGRRIRTLASGYLTANEYRATWDGRDEGGRPLASGVYLIRLSGGDFVETQRVALVK